MPLPPFNLTFPGHCGCALQAFDHGRPGHYAQEQGTTTTTGERVQEGGLLLWQGKQGDGQYRGSYTLLKMFPWVLRKHSGGSMGLKGGRSQWLAGRAVRRFDFDAR
jgi:hypothetical protein